MACIVEINPDIFFEYFNEHPNAWYSLINQKTWHFLFGEGNIININLERFINESFATIQFNKKEKNNHKQNPFNRIIWLDNFDGKIIKAISVPSHLNSELKLFEEKKNKEKQEDEKGGEFVQNVTSHYEENRKPMIIGDRERIGKKRGNEGMIFNERRVYSNNSIEEKQKEELINRVYQIQKFCQEREIRTLVHFTQIHNLASIIKYGLISRSEIVALNGVFSVEINDPKRLDGQLNATCLSISFPNYRMFHRYSSQKKDNWVVILLKASILWELDCAFCRTNAASSEITQTPLFERKKVEALKVLFEDYRDIKRTNLYIPIDYPTNPQAEILVFEPIHPNYIQYVYFYERVSLENWQSNNGDVFREKLACNTDYFIPRNDWRFWS